MRITRTPLCIFFGLYHQHFSGSCGKIRTFLKCANMEQEQMRSYRTARSRFPYSEHPNLSAHNIESEHITLPALKTRGYPVRNSEYRKHGLYPHLSVKNMEQGENQSSVSVKHPSGIVISSGTATIL